MIERSILEYILSKWCVSS